MLVLFFFFFNDTATTEIYTLSLHDALPISKTPSAPTLGRCGSCRRGSCLHEGRRPNHGGSGPGPGRDRESTRLKSSHLLNSYSVFFFEKKKKKEEHKH